MKEQVDAKLDLERASKDKKRAENDESRAKIDQKKATEEQADAKNNREKAMNNKFGSEKDQALVKIDQEHAKKNQEQAKLNQEQAKKNEVQAKINQKQAFEDERLMKSMIDDLINDGIITHEKDLSSVSLNSTEMTVNGKKQPEEVFDRYKEKYKRLSSGNFTYQNEPNGNKGVRMNKQNR